MAFVSNVFAHDVFLSYRGEDTRYDFTVDLSKAFNDRGIRTIMDDLKLQTGEGLFEAIERSRTAIPVLSHNYAFSPFCLEELCKILECIHEKGRSVWPVFYDVDRSDVKMLSGTYGEAMAKHEASSNHNMDTLQKWKNALQRVANLPGFHFKKGAGRNEFKFIGRTVEAVCRKLNHVADYGVGMESRLEELSSLLELGHDGVLILGIYGRVGMGKSALARAVCNKIAGQFEGLCFLDRVRENADKHGLGYLQNMLLSEIVGKKHFRSRNLSILRRMLHQKKVLLILDDVDTLERLEALVGESDWFGSGSRVIITTRDKHLLTFHRVERTYEVQGLNRGDALEMLSGMMFKQGNVDPSYTEILNQAVTYASGLPFALEAIGLDLCGKSVDECRETVDRLKRIPHKYIQKIHKTSFDALGKDEQSVFLDIACCFRGYELAEVKNILCAHHGCDMKSHIKLLIDKSFISISLDGKVTLHPLMEGLGKEIVLQESPTEPGKRSRLWSPEDIVQVLKENTGTSKIEIIHLDSPLIEDEEVIAWDGGAFTKMKNLKTLIIRKCHFSKAPKHLPYSLRVLKWWGYPSQELPSDFDLAQLNICELPDRGCISSRQVGLLKTSLRVAGDILKVSQTVLHAEITWRLVGLVSSIVGLSFNALSPSFNRLIEGWNSLKFFLYLVVSLVICIIMLFGKPSSFFTRHVQLKICMNFMVLMFISVYSFFYDKAVDGKPEILGLVSYAAFSLMSLSFAKLIKSESETGVFTYFLGGFLARLFTIDLKLILLAILGGWPIFYVHSSSNSRPEVDCRGEAIRSSLGSEPEVTSGGHVIHSSPDSRPEFASGGHHVVDIRT